MTTEQSILTALRNFSEIKSTGADAIIVKRTDHPHIDGDYYYAIRPADKTKWTAGETALTVDEVADLWYAADCPGHTTKTSYTQAEMEAEAQKVLRAYDVHDAA